MKAPQKSLAIFAYEAFFPHRIFTWKFYYLHTIVQSVAPFNESFKAKY